MITSTAVDFNPSSTDILMMAAGVDDGKEAVVVRDDEKHGQELGSADLKSRV